MRDLLVAAIIFGSIPFIFKRPFIGALMWCWISYMVPHRLGWGFAQTLPAALLIAVCLLTAYLFSKEPKKVPWTPVTVTLVLFLLWMCVTTLVAPPSELKMIRFEKVMKIQLITLIILAMLTTRERIEQALWVVALSIGFFGFKGGIFTIQTGGGGTVWGPPGGFFSGNNELGLTLLVIVPVLFYLMSQTQNRWIRYGLMATIALSTISTLGTQSRGALVAATAVGVFLWLKSQKKLQISIVFAIFIPVALSLMPQSWYDRMDTILEDKVEDYDGSVQGRLNAWQMAFNLAKDNVFGGGFHATNRQNFILYAPDPLDFHDSHSIYFQILGQHGFIGLALFLLLGLLSWRTASRIIKQSKLHEDLQWAGNLARMLQCSLIAFATGGTFLGLAYFDLPYHIIITLVAVEQLVKVRTEPKSTSFIQRPQQQALRDSNQNMEHRA
ncbi:putative O-glycosylation ligase, exosortase A system-associated [Motiliproteus sp.]|uniref:putative O-glycosylation ligase, exosortase A system-associated n=1 Tax=Motiliproteus sp. TaxID=1898955 RepID=UPI003BAD60F1